MPRRTDRHAAVLNKLQSVIEHTDPKIADERRLAIERWGKTYIRQVESLEEDELQFLYNIFRDERCWSGEKLNNTSLGQKLTEESINGIENPFSRYLMACRYCVKEKIKDFFQEKFDIHKSRFSPDAVDDDGEPAASNDNYIRRDLLHSMENYDPVFSFWIDRESEELKLKEYSDIEGFREAVDLKWSEGVEYFYNLLNEQEREEEMTVAVIALSNIQCKQNCATVLDFCLHEMDGPAKRDLLLKLSKKDQGVYSLLKGLIFWGFLDTVQGIVRLWCYEVVSVSADKILSRYEYARFLSWLSNVMLENHKLGVEARSVFMDLWRCDRFDEHKKAAVDLSKCVLTKISMKYVLARLIVDLRRDDSGKSDDRNAAKKDEILEILRFAKSCCSAESFSDFKKDIINVLRISDWAGMKKGIDYDKFAEKLFDEVPTPPRGGRDLEKFFDPQSMLGSAVVSGLSDNSK